MTLTIHAEPTGAGTTIIAIALAMAVFFAASMADTLVGTMASTLS